MVVGWIYGSGLLDKMWARRIWRVRIQSRQYLELGNSSI